MKYQDAVLCNCCNKHSAVLFWDKRYNGNRGTCVLCGGNWAES